MRSRVLYAAYSLVYIILVFSLSPSRLRTKTWRRRCVKSLCNINTTILYSVYRCSASYFPLPHDYLLQWLHTRRPKNILYFTSSSDKVIKQSLLQSRLTHTDRRRCFIVLNGYRHLLLMPHTFFFGVSIVLYTKLEKK